MNKSYRILIINLKEILRLKGWSQAILAERSGTSQERISNLLNGKTEPTLYLVDKIADALEIKTIELLDRETHKSIVREEQSDYQGKDSGLKFTKYGKNSKFKNVNVHIPNLKKFRNEFIQFNFNEHNPNSGKPNSYANYMEYILQNYYDNFGEVLDPFDKENVNKIEKLRMSPAFSEYNLREARFPNATIESYLRFIQEI